MIREEQKVRKKENNNWKKTNEKAKEKDRK